MTGSPRLPDFLVIGAMKSATSTLHEQLARQPGVFMSEPKEPCYFSDDPVYERGEAWYRNLFAGAALGDLCGESSTHYTKLPTFPNTVGRIAAAFPDPHLVYVMRHPVDRMISHYLHARSFGQGPDDIVAAIDEIPELVDYSRYGYQLRPFVEAFGSDRIHLMFFEELKTAPELPFRALGEFLGAGNSFEWVDLPPANVSAERLRLTPRQYRLMHNPSLTRIRRRLVPKPLRQYVARRLTLGSERPMLPETVRADLVRRFDEDLAELSELVGREMSCASFSAGVP